MNHKVMKNVSKIKKILAENFRFKFLQFFDDEIQIFFFSTVQDTWNYIVIKFSAMQFHPNLKANDFNMKGDAMAPS